VAEVQHGRRQLELLCRQDFAWNVPEDRPDSIAVAKHVNPEPSHSSVFISKVGVVALGEFDAVTLRDDRGKETFHERRVQSLLPNAVDFPVDAQAKGFTRGEVHVAGATLDHVGLELFDRIFAFADAGVTLALGFPADFHGSLGRDDRWYHLYR
ncbi:MAG: hypothetical protein ACK56I_18145, partial [bacterium]